MTRPTPTIQALINSARKELDITFVDNVLKKLMRGTEIQATTNPSLDPMLIEFSTSFSLPFGALLQVNI